MPKTAMQDPDRQRLLDKGWKLLSVDGKKRYWISPYDDKTYVEPHALTVQDMKDVEKRQEELTRPASWEPNSTDLTEEEFDKRFPPIKKKTIKKAKPKKAAPKKRSKNAKR